MRAGRRRGRLVEVGAAAFGTGPRRVCFQFTHDFREAPRVSATHRCASARGRRAVSDGVNVGAATCGPRGSPFQLPTELADGLGLGSDLGAGYPVPFAPPSIRIEDLGSPVPIRRKADQLRLQQTGDSSLPPAGLSMGLGQAGLDLVLNAH